MSNLLTGPILVILALVLYLYFLMTKIHYVFFLQHHGQFVNATLPSRKVTNTASPSATTVTSADGVFVTLLFNIPTDRAVVDHNCARLSRSGYKFEIYTDSLDQSYCSVCECIQFVPRNCSCPHPDRYDCPLCEKLHFLLYMILTKDEFVFIDSDLIILRDDFMPALLGRTKHFDFIASYGFGNYSRWKYSGPFNSGLMFVRRLDHIDYHELIALMTSLGTNNDQNVISDFIHRKYKRWDTLSLQWHCRYLFRSEHDIDFHDCFTFHGRWNDLKSALNRENFTLLRTEF